MKRYNFLAKPSYSQRLPTENFHASRQFFNEEIALDRTTKAKWKHRNKALQLIADGVPPTDAATQLSQTWGCSRRTSLRDIELAQSELANALNSVELQHMVGWLATQYQRLAAKSEKAQQYSAAIGALNSLRAMLVQPQLDRQFDAHFRGRFSHQVHRR